MDEFVYVLLAGLALIAVAIFVWGEPSENGTIVNNTTVIQPFSIGSFPQDAPRHIRIGDFDVSYAVGSEDIETARNVEIEKGVFSSSHHTMSAEVDKNLDMVTSGFVNINVLDTNSEGNLVVKFNDNEVFNQIVSRGQVEIPIDTGIIEDYNVIEISTTHPGWKFWKSSVYKLDKVEFGLNFWGNTKKIEEFVVYQDELDNFRSGEVIFKVDNIKGIGDLIIEINGRTVYKGEPNFDFKKSFDVYDVGLRKGVNTISFSAESGVTYEIDDAEIVIIHEEVGIKTRSFDFTVTTAAYNNLEDDDGEIKFRITDSDYRGNLLVSITDDDGNTHPTETIQSYSIGDLISIDFNQNHVTPGMNKLNFEVAGDGNFVISNVEVNLP